MIQGKPVLGICRGCQLINVALGGTLWQNLPSQAETSGNHNDPIRYLTSNERQPSAISLSFKGRAGEGMGWHDRTSDLSILPPPSISPPVKGERNIGMGFC